MNHGFGNFLDAPPLLDPGLAGESARREYERRHLRRQARIDQRWGRLAGVVKLLSEDPQSTSAWKSGSEGERVLATRLSSAIGDRAILLNDRKVPKSRANIDHLVVAPSGVWVIDAKNYKGRVEQRDKGGWFTSDLRLFVNGRDRSKLADGLSWQVQVVETVLEGAEVPVTAVLCFTDAEWPLLFAKPIKQGGTLVTWPKKLVEMIAEPGPLRPDTVFSVAETLSNALPPFQPSTH